MKQEYPGQVTHGMTGTPLWNAYYNMRARCYQESYVEFERYGGRGIGVCDEWRNDFEAFIAWAEVNGFQEGLQLDRKDNDGDYTPENCRWVTRHEQMQNWSRNQNVTINGETKCYSEWARIAGIHRCTFRGRYLAGYRGQDLLAPAGVHVGRNQFSKPINARY